MLLRQKSLHVSNRISAIMKNARSKYGISPTLKQNFGHMFQTARTSAGYHGHPDRLAHPARDDQIKTRLGAIGVDGVQYNLPGAQAHGFSCPLHRIQPGVLASAM